MTSSTTTLLIIGACLALAGCGGSTAVDSGGGAPPSRVEVGDRIADAGRVEGSVVDDEANPIPQATVALTELEVEAVTGLDGTYAFDNVPPGTHKIAALRLGYEQVLHTIEVPANGVVTKIFTLAPIAVVESYRDTFGPLQGYFECAVGTPSLIRTCQALAPTVFTNDKNRLSFQLTADHWETFVSDMRWRPSAFGTSNALANFMSLEGRTTTHWWCDSDGPTPNQFRFENEKTDGPDSVCVSQGSAAPAEPLRSHKLFTQADTGFGGLTASNPPVRVSFQQSYEMLMTVFYGEPAPEGFVGFPDQ